MLNVVFYIMNNAILHITYHIIMNEVQNGCGKLETGYHFVSFQLYDMYLHLIL